MVLELGKSLEVAGAIILLIMLLDGILKWVNQYNPLLALILVVIAIALVIQKKIVW